MNRIKVSAGALLVTMGFTLAFVGLTPSCNLVVDASADSCTTDADCVNLANTGCDTAQGICVSLDKCSKNADCPDDQICRRFSPRTCVSLTTPVPTDPSDENSTEPNCQMVYPDDPAVWRDDTTILIGMTAPRSDMDGPTVDTITNGAILAVDEINDKGGVNATQKLALVVCDDYGSSNNFAANNGRALAAMGVQAIIGAAYSGQTIEMATPASGDPGTVAAGVLAISPSATSADLTGVLDGAPACVSACGGSVECKNECPGLLWRTSPSDEIQGQAINEYFKELEPVVKARTGMVQAKIKVTILHKGDSYGKGLANFVKTDLEFNGDKANLQTADFKVRDYGEESTPDPAVIAAAIADQADVYMLFCTFTELEGALLDIEAGWQGPLGSEPYYLISDGGLNSIMLAEIATAGAQARVRGTIPGTAVDNSLFVNFKASYSERFPNVTADGRPDTFGSAGAYDAVYLLAYSAVAAQANALTGEQLARGLPLMADVAAGKLILVGPNAFGPALNELQAGKGINFEGASGPLDFDPQTDEAPSDIQVWCVTQPDGTDFSGRYFDAKTGNMKGPADPAIVPANASCPF